MSYCVNCGVELHAAAIACPLCNTAVYNPKQPVDLDAPTPYPVEIGQSEEVKNHEIALLLAVVFMTTGVVCGLLNLTVFTLTRWSLYVIGMLAVTWVLLMPVFFRNKTVPFAYIALDGLAVALFVGMIAWLHPGEGWYTEIAFPIIALSTGLCEVFYLFTIRMKIPRIIKAVVILCIIAVISVAIELLVQFHFHRQVVLIWSAVVLACCVTAGVMLLTIASRKGLRNELRRRMHF